MNTTEDDERAAEAARVERVYGGYARSGRRQRAWAASNPGNLELRQELLTALLDAGAHELGGSGRILDAGCGGGYWPRQLVDRGVDPGRVLGVDLRSERVAVARRSCPEASFACADVRRLPYPDRHFTLVLALTLLSSLGSSADVRRALVELRRVLTADGAILVYEPRLPNPLNRSVRLVRLSALVHVLGAAMQVRSLTLAPPLARRLGRSSDSLYPRLARIPVLRTHRLLRFEPGGAR